MKSLLGGYCTLSCGHFVTEQGTVHDVIFGLFPDSLLLALMKASVRTIGVSSKPIVKADLINEVADAAVLKMILRGREEDETIPPFLKKLQHQNSSSAPPSSAPGAARKKGQSPSSLPLGSPDRHLTSEEINTAVKLASSLALPHTKEGGVTDEQAALLWPEMGVKLVGMMSRHAANLPFGTSHSFLSSQIDLLGTALSSLDS